MFRKLALGLLFIVAASVTGATTVMAQSRMYGSFNSFYDDLAPYGRWANNREYGEVWIPNVERGFQPYATRGHWAVTEYGNTWVSDYDWGWAPFHYGRWAFDDFYGWIWVPGQEWGPAWVSWRSDNDYYGWAPLGPGVDVNININIPVARWIFVPKRYIVQRNVYDYCVPRQRVEYVYRNTVVINNIYVNGNRRYASGPYRNDMERSTRQRIDVYRVENYGRPGRMEERDGALRVYRPESNQRRDHYSGDNDSRGTYYNARPGSDGNRGSSPDRSYKSNEEGYNRPVRPGSSSERFGGGDNGNHREDRDRAEKRPDPSGSDNNRTPQNAERQEPRQSRNPNVVNPNPGNGNSQGQASSSERSNGRGNNNGGGNTGANPSGRGRPVRG